MKLNNVGIPKKVDKMNWNELKNFYVNFIRYDNLGIIANNHLAISDLDINDKCNNKSCLKLAELHSVAVDYPKTGIRAIIPKEMILNVYPHYMSYKKKTKLIFSESVIGKIFDGISWSTVNQLNTNLKKNRSKQKLLMNPSNLFNFKKYLSEAKNYYLKYHHFFRCLVIKYGLNESEVLLGKIKKKKKRFRKIKTFARIIKEEYEAIFDKFRKIFLKISENDNDVEKISRAYSWYFQFLIFLIF